MESAARLDVQAARAAYSAAVAAYDGRDRDAETWSARAERLEAQAAAYRIKAK